MVEELRAHQLNAAEGTCFGVKDAQAIIGAEDMQVACDSVSCEDGTATDPGAQHVARLLFDDIARCDRGLRVRR